MSGEDEVTERSDAARRGGYLVTDRVDPLHEESEQEADMIRREAYREAERIRREAVTAAERLRGRIQALEFPLGQLVADLREETERVTRQIGNEPHLESHAAPRPVGDGTAPKPVADEAVMEQSASHEAERPAESVVPRSEAATWRAPDSAPPAAPVDLGEPSTGEGAKGRFLARRKPKRQRGSSVSVEGSCAICGRAFKAGSQEELSRSQWKVSGDVGLCPACQAERWQLPEGARVPFRRGGS